MNEKHKKNYHLTFIEVILAVAILIIALLVLSSIFTLGMQTKAVKTNISEYKKSIVAYAEYGIEFDGVEEQTSIKEISIVVNNVRYIVQGEYKEYQSNKRKEISTYRYIPKN